MKNSYDLKKFQNIPFTHATLKSILKEYNNPNDKIASLIRNKEIISLKKGLYVLSLTKDISCELLANHIYGPSYVSLDFALSFYGLIPERVYEITSICTNRAKVFENKFGRFSYIKSPNSLFHIGVNSITKGSTSYLIASVEKSLSDKIIFTKNLKVTSRKSMIDYLEQDLRIDMNKLKEFDINVIEQCVKAGYKKDKLKILISIIKELQC